MRALCLITIKPGTIDKTVNLLSKRRKIAKEVLPVTGRADICILMNGSIDDINKAIMDFNKIRKITKEGYPRAESMPSAGFAAGPCLLKDTMQLLSFSFSEILGRNLPFRQFFC